MAIALLLAACLLLLIVLYLASKKTHKLAFPGPNGFPIFGSFFALRCTPIHELMLEWDAKYGGVFTFSVFGARFLVIGSPEALQEALVTRGKDFAGRPPSNAIKFLTDGNQNISHSSLALSKVLRKASQSVLNAYCRGRGSMDEILETAVDHLVDRFQEKGGEPFDPWEELYGATSLTIFMMISGQPPEDHTEVTRTMREYNQTVTDVAAVTAGSLLLELVPAIRFSPWCPPYQKLLHCKRKQDETCDKIVWLALEKSKSSKNQNLGKVMLDSIGESYGLGKESTSEDKAGHVSMTNVKQICLDMIVTGNETTATSAYMMLNILQSKPELQEKVAEEIARIVGTANRVTVRDRDDLPYSRAVVLELLRYTSISPVGIPHVTTRDTSLCGTPVPAGTFVFTNLWACHHDPKLWDDPWEFKPERFLDDDGQLVPADHPNRKQLFPFGAGPRVCVGEVLALNRLFLFLTNILQKFQLVQPDGASSVSCDARDYKYGILMQPPTFQLCAIPRTATV